MKKLKTRTKKTMYYLSVFLLIFNLSLFNFQLNLKAASTFITSTNISVSKTTWQETELYEWIYQPTSLNLTFTGSNIESITQKVNGLISGEFSTNGISDNTSVDTSAPIYWAFSSTAYSSESGVPRTHVFYNMDEYSWNEYKLDGVTSPATDIPYFTYDMLRALGYRYFTYCLIDEAVSSAYNGRYILFAVKTIPSQTFTDVHNETISGSINGTGTTYQQKNTYYKFDIAIDNVIRSKGGNFVTLSIPVNLLSFGTNSYVIDSENCAVTYYRNNNAISEIYVMIDADHSLTASVTICDFNSTYGISNSYVTTITSGSVYYYSTSYEDTIKNNLIDIGVDVSTIADNLDNLSVNNDDVILAIEENTAKLNEIYDLIDSLDIEHVDQTFNDIINEYDIDIGATIGDLINDFNDANDNIDLTDPSLNLPNNLGSELSSLGSESVGFFDTIFDNGLGIYFIIPFVVGIIGLIL